MSGQHAVPLGQIMMCRSGSQTVHSPSGGGGGGGGDSSGGGGGGDSGGGGGGGGGGGDWPGGMMWPVLWWAQATPGTEASKPRTIAAPTHLSASPLERLRLASPLASSSKECSAAGSPLGGERTSSGRFGFMSSSIDPPFSPISRLPVDCFSR